MKRMRCLAVTLAAGLLGSCAAYYEYDDRPYGTTVVIHDYCYDWWPYVYYAPYDCWYGHGRAAWYGPTFFYYPYRYPYRGYVYSHSHRYYYPRYSEPPGRAWRRPPETGGAWSGGGGHRSAPPRTGRSESGRAWRRDRDRR